MAAAPNRPNAGDTAATAPTLGRVGLRGRLLAAILLVDLTTVAVGLDAPVPDLPVAHHVASHDVQFVIAPHERERWRDLAALDIAAPHFANLHELACCVYESGWFIGNDSGIGHLASNLGIPSLSLFRRRRVAERWRPAWQRRPCWPR